MTWRGKQEISMEQGKEIQQAKQLKKKGNDAVFKTINATELKLYRLLIGNFYILIGLIFCLFFIHLLGSVVYIVVLHNLFIVLLGFALFFVHCSLYFCRLPSSSFLFSLSLLCVPEVHTTRLIYSGDYYCRKRLLLYVYMK